jgi:hypothetical protein
LPNRLIRKASDTTATPYTPSNSRNTSRPTNLS